MKKGIVKKIVNRIYPFSHLAFYTQRLITRPSHRKLAVAMARNFLPKHRAPLSVEIKHDLNNLNNDGYLTLDNLIPKDQIHEMVSWLSDKKVFDRWRPDNGFFDPDTPSPDCHTALFSTEDVVRCPYAMEWANNPKVLSIVGHALGAKPTLSNISIWWSYPGHEKPQEAENFHRDVDDLAFIKLFIYLTDVDDGCGPHVFVPGSQNKQIFGKIRRYSDEEIENTFGQDGIKTFTGPQGSAFLENTFGLHKGQLPKKKRRLLFQAQYSLHPIGIYKYNPIAHSKIPGEQLDNYTNRLYVLK